jgi:hypothetical protein
MPELTKPFFPNWTIRKKLTVGIGGTFLQGFLLPPHNVVAFFLYTLLHGPTHSVSLSNNYSAQLKGITIYIYVVEKSSKNKTSLVLLR